MNRHVGLLFTIGCLLLARPFLWGQESQAELQRSVDAIKKLGGKVSLAAGVAKIDLDKTKKTDLCLAIIKKGFSRYILLLNLRGSMVTDTGMLHLKRAQLQTLQLSDSKISDKGLAVLKGSTSLQILELNRTEITDQGIANLTNLPKLVNLYLSETKITDAGLAHLKNLPALKHVQLRGTKVTAEAVKRLLRETKASVDTGE
jgi:Leucine-rich repeat (LRR) protein